MAIRTAAGLGAGADAEDVVQEAFVKAYAALGRLRPAGRRSGPWFLRIVANETRNLHRAAGRRSARERRALRLVPAHGLSQIEALPLGPWRCWPADRGRAAVLG